MQSDDIDVAVLLSRWEAFGLVLAEYMAASKPIVCTNADAMPELVQDGENGFVVNIEDFDAVAKLIIQLANNKELCAVMAARGYKKAKEKFALNIEIDSITSLLKSCACL